MNLHHAVVSQIRAILILPRGLVISWQMARKFDCFARRILFPRGMYGLEGHLLLSI